MSRLPARPSERVDRQRTLRFSFDGREVADFAFGGEVTRRPRESPTFRELSEYNYFRRNVAGVQREWWCHRTGCGQWFLAERDTRTNTVLETRIPAPGGVRPE